MRKKIIFLFLMLSTLIFGISAVADATLIDRGGGLIYDDYANITWLQNANYNPEWFWSNWYDAVYIAETFVYYDSVRDVYWDDWRLPSAYNIDGSGPCSGYNCTQSEMGHLYYIDLGNVAGGPLTNKGIFENIQAGHYWLGEPDFWYFNMRNGVQGYADCMYVWPVRNGDVGLPLTGVVPEPATILLLGTGVLGLAGLRKKSRK